MTNIKDMVANLFETKNRIINLQMELNQKLIPELSLKLIHEQRTEYLSLNYAKLHKDFIQEKGNMRKRIMER